MSPQYLTKDFAKQFRNECELYSPAEEYQYGKLRVKKFKGNDADVLLTGRKLTEMFFNVHLIDLILSTLRNKNLPAATKLITKTTALKNKCESYIQLEPYTAHFYNEHIAVLQSFSELTAAFYTDFQDQIYSQLSTYYIDIHEQNENPVAESSSLSEIIGLIEFYLKNILSYYNYFIVTWQHEANSNKGIQLTTYMADHLQMLIVFMEEMIAGIEEMRSLFLNWEAEIIIKDEQELYN